MVKKTAKYPPVVILLAEDDPGDQMITQEAFKSFTVPYELRVVSDGREALEYLYRQGRYELEPAPPPDLIVLDLNMPLVSGQQVARRVQADPRLRRTPVVVLTTSRREEDVLRAYSQGVLYFMCKPLEFQRFLAAVQQLEQVVKLALALKSLRDRRSITDRQIRRLARLRHQLNHSADVLFDDHMKRIETISSGSEGRQDRELEASLEYWHGEAAARQGLLRLADRLLQACPAEPWSPSPGARHEPAALRRQEIPWTEAHDTGRDLSKLARSLDSPQEELQPSLVRGVKPL